MTTRSSAKAKGRKMQKLVAERIQDFLCLDDRDVVSTPASVTGEDIMLSERAKKMLPLSYECKWNESLSIWSALKQAESNCGTRFPMVVFKRSRSDVYCAIKFEDMFKLLNMYHDMKMLKRDRIEP